jgi:hypothetical protein
VLPEYLAGRDVDGVQVAERACEVGDPIVDQGRGPWRVAEVEMARGRVSDRPALLAGVGIVAPPDVGRVLQFAGGDDDDAGRRRNTAQTGAGQRNTPDRLLWIGKFIGEK